MQIDAAYLIVKRFNSLYAEYAQNPKCDKAIYALPLFNTTPEQAPVKYHGLDRDPLQAYKFKEALAAEIRMAELEKLDRCVGAYLFDPHDVVEASNFIDYYTSFDWTEEGDYEIIEVWAPISKINQIQRRDI